LRSALNCDVVVNLKTWKVSGKVGLNQVSRRSLLAGLTSLGAMSVTPSKLFADSAKAELASPPSSGETRKQSSESLVRYFAANAPQLLRAPAGIMKYPSISPTLPGKQYSSQLWDWDTLWTSRGLFRLAELERDDALRMKIAQHVSGSLLNFLEHAAKDGRLPILMSATDPDTLGTVGPGTPLRNQAKPVFSQLALLAADQRGDVSWLSPHFDTILHFYSSWTKHNLSPIGLLVWGDDVAIGNDNDPTTFGRPAFSSANLLLNCLYYEDLRAAAELAKRLARPADYSRLSAEAEAVSKQMRKYCWDPRDSFFYTVDVQCVDRRAELIPTVARGMNMSWKSLPLRLQVFTGFLPMWCGIASQSQADELVRVNYANDDRLCARWGVRSLSSRESMYSLDFSSNPSNWLGPVWIIANYFTWKGLERYGFHEEARALADKTIALLANDLAVNGSLNEYYHPDTGAALSHKGFMDWNLLVLEMI
jgi:putative isomerase